MGNRKWLHVTMVLVLLLSIVSSPAISKTHAETGLSQVSLTETEKGFTLSWEATLSQDEEITNYQLSKNGQVTEIEPTVHNVNENVKQFSYEDTDVVPNNTYAYEITALTTAGNILSSGQVIHIPQEGETAEQSETETPEETKSEELAENPELDKEAEPIEMSDPTEAEEEIVVTNIKVSTIKGYIPWEFEYWIEGISESAADIGYYGYLDDEGFFVNHDNDSKNLELPIGTYKLTTYNYSTEEEITAEFKVESERDYLANPIEVQLEDEKLIIKKEIYIEGYTEESISIYWDEPWDETEIVKYLVYLNGQLVEEITDPYSTFYTYNGLSEETTYQVRVDIYYKDGIIETLENEAKTIAQPAGETVKFKDENLRAAVAEALKIYHRETIYVVDMGRLEHLEAGYLEIQYLNGLENARNLEYLILSGNEIKDLSPIKNLKELVYLDLDENQISTIKTLADLEKLDNLNLAFNELEEIDTLLKLQSLTYVSVNGNQGLDFSKGSQDMAVIKKLQEKGVHVEWNDIWHDLFITNVTESSVEFEIEFYDIIENITKYLIYVNDELVGETPASEPSYKLKDLEPLSEIYIDVQGVDEEGFVWGSAFSFVQTLPIPSGEPVHFVDSALEDAVRDALFIRSRQLVESDLSILTFLDATDRGITDLTGIENAVNLEELHLDMNAITDLEPLKGLSKLTYLSLMDNEIKDISALENLNIEFLDISYNQITDISSLLTLENLFIALIMGNPLDLTEGSKAMEQIKILEDKDIFVMYEYLDISVDHVSDSEIGLSWQPITSDGFTDFIYEVYLDEDEEGFETNDTNYLLTELEPETKYLIRILGYDEDFGRFILGAKVVTTAAPGEEPIEEPGGEPADETDPGETPEKQPVDDEDEVSTPAKDNSEKSSYDKNDDKKSDDKKLPKTATYMYSLLLLGLLLLGVGMIAITAPRKLRA